MDYAFVCACDSPFLRADLASSLCGMLEQYDAVVREIAGLDQPLLPFTASAALPRLIR